MSRRPTVTLLRNPRIAGRINIQYCFCIRLAELRKSHSAHNLSGWDVHWRESRRRGSSGYEHDLPRRTVYTLGRNIQNGLRECPIINIIHLQTARHLAPRSSAAATAVTDSESPMSTNVRGGVIREQWRNDSESLAGCLNPHSLTRARIILLNSASHHRIDPHPMAIAPRQSSRLPGGGSRLVGYIYIYYIYISASFTLAGLLKSFNDPEPFRVGVDNDVLLVKHRGALRRRCTQPVARR